MTVGTFIFHRIATTVHYHLLTAFLKNSNLTWRLKSEKLYQFPRVRIKWCCIHFTSNIQEALLKLQTHTGEVWGRIFFIFYTNAGLCVLCSSICTLRTENKLLFTTTDLLVMWKLPDWGSASGWNVPTMYYIIIMDYASVITLDEQHACNECSNTQTHRIQKYVNWTTSDFTVRPQILLSDLRIYSTTSEFTVRPQNLQYDLRIYSTTSEFTVRPQNLQYDLRVLLSDLGFWKFKF